MRKDEKLWFSPQLWCSFVVKHLENVLVFDPDPVSAEDHPVVTVRHDRHDDHLRVVLLRKVLRHLLDEFCSQIHVDVNLELK